jgi:hypothetical protein
MGNRKLFGNRWSFIFVGIIILLSGITYGQTTEELDKVASTLKTPTLLDDYLQTNFSWASERDGGGCGGVNIGAGLKDCAPHFIFKNKKGNCGAYTTFAVYCLRKAGYKAYPLYVYDEWPPYFAPGASPRDYHILVLYEEKGKLLTIDRGKPRNPEGIKGPYNKVEDLPYKVLKVDKEY